MTLDAQLDPLQLTRQSGLVSRNVLVDGGDLDEARERVSRIFVEHRLSAPADRQPRPVTVSHCGFDAVSLCYFDYGREVLISPDQLNDFYLMVVPVVGRISVQSGDTEIGIGVGQATILPALRRFRTRWSSDARQLILRIDRRKMTRHLARHLDSDCAAAPDFHMQLEWSAPQMAPLRHAVGVLASLAESPMATGHAQIAAPAEETLLNALLFRQYSDLSAALADGRLSTACPRNVRRAEEYICANLDQPITIGDLVAAAGGSPRALFEGFRRFRGLAPMQFVRQQRLLRVRRMLMDDASVQSVSAAALQWGFQHLGRFSADYATAFGETPSQTLKQARRRRS
ncbi:MAG: AraC family protein [Rhodobacteraceae bacterium HLUCCA12]|nr:MAG: AraC family protein [Rhodobacteraceae bacterium HLUCCA12]